MSELRDEFLSEEDLALRDLTWEALIAAWNAWLLAAQSTNGADRRAYSHGAFVLALEPEPAPDCGTEPSTQPEFDL